MKIETHEEILNEVLDEIESALKDPKVLISHQRRLAFLLSFGAINILEIYFHTKEIIKEGSKINHRWFRKKENKVYEYLQKQITSPINSIENINQILDKIIKIEEKRDELAYGSPVKEEILQEKINLFFELRKLLKC